jgi:hypothetical protein
MDNKEHLSPTLPVGIVFASAFVLLQTCKLRYNSFISLTSHTLYCMTQRQYFPWHTVQMSHPYLIGVNVCKIQ